MAKKVETAVAVVRKSENGFPVVDLTKTLPSLKEASEAPIDLVGDYWTPETHGESRRMFFSHISDRQVKDEETGEIVMLPCAFFMEQGPNGIRSVCNASKRLVGAMENAKVERGTPLQITWIGKKKNKTNMFQSDNWSIKPLMIPVTVTETATA